jgi:hypothetical protein
MHKGRLQPVNAIGCGDKGTTGKGQGVVSPLHPPPALRIFDDNEHSSPNEVF